MSRPLKDREAFFSHVEKGLQAYFDGHDTYWGGILHFTIGVKCGEVGGIIKSQNMLSYEGFTLSRVSEILKYVLPRYMARTDVALAIGDVMNELRMAPDEPQAPKRMGRPKRIIEN